MFNTCIKSRLWGNKDQQNYFNYITDCRKSEFLNLLQIPQAEEHLISWVNKAMLDEADCSDWGFLCGIFFSFCLWVFVCLFACWLFFFKISQQRCFGQKALRDEGRESLGNVNLKGICPWWVCWRPTIFLWIHTTYVPQSSGWNFRQVIRKSQHWVTK